MSSLYLALFAWVAGCVWLLGAALLGKLSWRIWVLSAATMAGGGLGAWLHMRP